MRYLVGYVADDTGLDALALAGMLARADQNVELVLCSVLPREGAVPARGAPAAGFTGILYQQAEQWLTQARARLPGLTVEPMIRVAASPALGLAQAVEEVAASMLVVGSARGGLLRRLAVGSVNDHLLHSSPVPLAVAPLGFGPPDGRSLQRVSCGFLDRPGDIVTVLAARQLARRNHLGIRLVTVIVGGRKSFPPVAGVDEDRVREDREQTVWAAERAQGVLPEDRLVETTVTQADDLESALGKVEWLDGEVLFLGSSRLGPPARVSLGATGSAILRSSPVPVVALPRGADVSLETTTEISEPLGRSRRHSGTGNLSESERHGR
jgi:nucleotide-binding universal stress UspA family protein